MTVLSNQTTYPLLPPKYPFSDFSVCMSEKWKRNGVPNLPLLNPFSRFTVIFEIACHVFTLLIDLHFSSLICSDFRLLHIPFHFRLCSLVLCLYVNLKQPVRHFLHSVSLNSPEFSYYIICQSNTPVQHIISCLDPHLKLNPQLF